SHTRVLFLSRPFLVGNGFTQDVNTAYDDQASSDGHFFAHLINELFRVINLQSRHVEAHPKIKSFPFKGNYRLPVLVRPPRPRTPRRPRPRPPPAPPPSRARPAPEPPRPNSSRSPSHSASAPAATSSSSAAPGTRSRSSLPCTPTSTPHPACPNADSATTSP